MTTKKLSEVKAHLGQYTEETVKGETFIIANRDRRLARLTPVGVDFYCQSLPVSVLRT